ncbi:MAG: hypothetical protein ACOYEV_02560 [Candidatus Nanopelagicales bacterium]
MSRPASSLAAVVVSRCSFRVAGQSYSTSVGCCYSPGFGAVVARYAFDVPGDVDAPDLKSAHDRFDSDSPGSTTHCSTDPVSAVQMTTEVEEDAEQMGLINTFGMFWRRSEVNWAQKSVKLLGIQQVGSQEIDFGEQAGVYLLYDGVRILYVGRVTEPRLDSRLWEHTRDRLMSRWDRFS